MEKIISVFIMLASLMAIGCSSLGTTQIPYSASVSQEKLCTLRIAPALTVTQFDGEPVQWVSAWGHWGEVNIPEGAHTFVLNYNAAHGDAQDIRFTGTFLAGRTYSMTAQPTTRTTILIRIVEGAL